MTYAEMFVAAIQSFGVLCIGLYRLRDATLSPDENPSAKRYVITNPADDSTLLHTDKVERQQLPKSANYLFSSLRENIRTKQDKIQPIHTYDVTCEHTSRVIDDRVGK